MSNSALAVDIKFPTQDVKALMRAMQRDSKRLNIPIEKSLKFAGWLVADSLRIATKMSAKLRPIEEIPGKKTRGGKKHFEVTRFDKHSRKSVFDVYAEGIRVAKKMRRVEIWNRGLAGKAWHWIEKEIGSGRGGRKVAAATARIAKRHGHTHFIARGDNSMLKISNSLDYASKAFVTSGERTVGNAVARAARRMVKLTKIAVAKKMGAK